MSTTESVGKERLYLGVDVGGTKILASLVRESGAIVGRQRCPSPRDCGPEQIVVAIEKAMADLLEKEGLETRQLTAIGVVVPGVVDPDEGRVVVTPNMNLTGVELVQHLEARFDTPVALGNDCNLGALGEKWLGSARNARSAFGIFVGTGIGGGFIQDGKMWQGARHSAAEIGHIVMQVGGPLCGCGNRGCLEALASRSAIERDLRQAVDAGRTTMLTELLEGDLSLIRSGAIRQALQAEDEVVTEIVRRASEILGHACLTVRHLLDPEVIVLGGGVVEACHDFIMPIVENIVGSDQLAGAREGGRVLLSALGDDAVVLGAVALARRRVGRSPFKKRFAVAPKYPELAEEDNGEISANRKTYARDICVNVNGGVKTRKKEFAKQPDGASHNVAFREVKKLCKGGPAVVFIGTGKSDQSPLDEEAQRYLSQRSIECQIMPTRDAIAAYNDCKQRKAALMRVLG